MQDIVAFGDGADGNASGATLEATSRRLQGQSDAGAQASALADVSDEREGALLRSQQRALQQRLERGRRALAPPAPRTPPIASRADLAALPQNDLAAAAARAAVAPDAADYDADRTGAPSPTGPAGTYNHLTDAILDVPRAREMYLRRLRTLMDTFLPAKLQGAVSRMFAEIRADADADNARWGAGDIARGYRCDCASLLACPALAALNSQALAS